LGDGNMIVFGGTSSFGYLNDVYEFDFKQWKRVKCCGNVPTPRHGHVSVFLNNQMYVFGGFDGSFCNDLYELDIKMKIWNEIELERKCPQRIFCSAVVYDDEMYLYGGTNEGGEYSDELYRVSLPRIGGDRYIAGSFVEMDSYKGSLNAK
jgi:N-acetylneuraminic acid mutarotase